MDNSNEFLNGLLNFNNFTKLKNIPGKKSLKDSLKRCQAVHFDLVRPVVDLVVPVWLNLKNFNLLSAIVVKVRHTNEPEIPDFKDAFKNSTLNLFDDLDPKKSILMLYIQFGMSKTKFSFIKIIKPISQSENIEPKCSILYSEGLIKHVFPQLDESLIEQLNELCNLTQNIFGNENDAQIRQILFS